MSHRCGGGRDAAAPGYSRTPDGGVRRSHDLFRRCAWELSSAGAEVSAEGLYRPSISLHRLAGRTAVETILDVRDHSLELLVAQPGNRIGMLDLVLTRNQQHGKFDIRGWLRSTNLRNRALTVLTKIAKKRANDCLA